MTTDELLAALTTDFKAVINRLSTVETWKNLTDTQRQAIVAARNRAGIGAQRIHDFTNTP